MTRLLRLPLTLGLLALALSACHPGGAPAETGGRGKRPVPVTVARVRIAAMPLTLAGVGTVQPLQSVAVKAQVGGMLEKVHFTQGQDVRQGDLLFSLDSGPLRAALAQAEASLAKDTAQAANAERQWARYHALYQEGGVSQEQYDQIRASRETLKGALAADRAAVENARLQLGYATLRAPIDGRTGSLAVTTGNLVKANDTTPLVVLHQLSPIAVTFTVPDRDLARVRRYLAGGPLAVTARPNSPDAASEVGKLDFIDNQVDPTTGTVQLRATFPNTDRHLWPGQFANVTLTLATETDARVVPVGAVQTGQKGTFVYVVGATQSVEVRPVTVDRTVEGDSVIKEGLQPGETVVTDGQLQLFPGAQVKVADPNGKKGKRHRA